MNKELPNNIVAQIETAFFLAENRRFLDIREEAYAAKDNMERQWGIREGDKCGCPNCKRSSVIEYNRIIEDIDRDVLRVYFHQPMFITTSKGKMFLITQEEAEWLGYV